MPVENRSLEAGTKLVARFKKEEHRCTVEQNEDGSVAFVLADGSRFKSPSAAGSAVIGGSCNGWRFWSVDGTLKQARSSSTPTEREPKPKGKPGRPARLFKVHKSQAGVAEGTTRFFCSGGMHTFDAPGSDTPTSCPAGHAAVPTEPPAA